MKKVGRKVFARRLSNALAPVLIAWSGACGSAPPPPSEPVIEQAAADPESPELSPEEYAIRRSLAMALLDEGEYAAAWEHLDYVLNAGGDSWWIHLAAAQVCLYWRLDYPCVQEHAGRALELRPGNARAHVYLGQLAQEEGRPEDAVHHYEQALLERGGDTEASIRLATLLFRRNEEDRALDVLTAALAFEPNNPRIMIHLSAMVESRDPALAESLLYDAAQRHETPQLAYQYLVQFYRRQGREREAQELQRWIEEQSPDREMRPLSGH
ncbi:MAG: tetratricopeptide repeat protein [Myxococcales bacterium]|nr:tetratricopeptide repeat protein [Myxococcales bacterium]